MDLKKLNEELNKLLETDLGENDTYDILKSVEENGFKDYILRVSILYDKHWYKDEDGDGSYYVTFNDFDTETTSYKKYIPLKPQLVKDRVFLGYDETSDSGEYPSGGTPDNISYTNYDMESDDRYYLINVDNNGLKLFDYIQQNYPDSQLTSIVNEANKEIDLGEMIKDIEDEDFE